MHWAIRTPGDALIGGCGFDGFEAGKFHRVLVRRAELGQVDLIVDDDCHGGTWGKLGAFMLAGEDK